MLYACLVGEPEGRSRELWVQASENLESQLFEELQSHSGLDDPHPQTPPTPTRFWPPFWPDFDLNLTNFDQIAPRGQNKVKFSRVRTKEVMQQHAS